MNNMSVLKIKHYSAAKRCKGFGIIETIVSFFLLAIGMLALLSFHNESQRTISEAKTQAEAIALAEEKLQELESYLSDTDSRLNDGTPTPESINGVLAAFTRSWTITTDGTNPSQKTAAVTVSWTDRNNASQSVMLSSNIFLKQPTTGMSEFIALVNTAQKAANGEYPEWDDGNGGGGEGGDDGGDQGGGDEGGGDEGGGDQGGGDEGGGDQGGGGGDEGGEGCEPDCEEPPEYITLTVSGSINASQAEVLSVDIWGSPTLNWSCSLGGSSYSCTTTELPGDETWSGTISFTTDEEFCVPSGTDSGPLQYSYSGINSAATYNVVVRKNRGQCNSAPDSGPG